MEPSVIPEKINETNFQKCLKEEEKTMKLVVSSLALVFIATLKEKQLSGYLVMTEKNDRNI